MRTIKEQVSAEIVVKKSKFIANIFPVNTENQAKEIIKKITKQYYDAKHNCYAYIIAEINNNVTKIEKSSDNGEPSGTAGAPMLDILRNKELINTLVIVTRYFGGILLGTGGLVKAYTDVTLEALGKAEIIKKEIGNRYKAEILYNELDSFMYICNKLEVKVKSTGYKENVEVILECSEEKIQQLTKSIKIEKISNIEKNVII